MKFWKSILLSACSFLALATTVTYTSCEKDACTELTCRNGGACAEGFCRCKTGYEGAECEVKIANRFLGTYVGYNHCDNNPALIDTVDIYLKAEPNVLGFYRRSDSATNKMEGIASGYNIIVQDQTGDNYRKHLNVVIDNKELTIHQEIYNGTRISVCDFVGIKP